MNHEITVTCPHCGCEYDARLHWYVCPQCGFEIPTDDVKQMAERTRLAESVETVQYFEPSLWPAPKKRRGRTQLTLCAPSNPSLSWDMAIRRLVEFAEKEINKEGII